MCGYTLQKRAFVRPHTAKRGFASNLSLSHSLPPNLTPNLFIILRKPKATKASHTSSRPEHIILCYSTFASIANALLAWSKKELSGANSATLHGVKRTFDCLRMRFKRKSIVMSEAVTPFYFTKLTPVYYLRNFSYVMVLNFRKYH